MNVKNPLEMTDEEILEAGPDNFAEEETEIETDGQQETTDETANQDSAPEGEEEQESAEEAEDDGDDESGHGTGEEDQESAEAPEAPDDMRPGLHEEGEDDSTETVKQGTPVDYKEVYERIFSPFKANGREVQVKDIDDVIRLMQMGVGYSEKVRAMKPHLQVLKTLEKNELLDESKIRFLIDVSNRRPEAIAKLLKDGEIDPMDLDLTDESEEYTPNAQLVSEEQVALEEVLDEIRSTDTFSRTVDELGNKWDAESRRIIAGKPELIKVINDHISLGIYDQIMGVVQQERLLGRLSGLTDLQAYKYVGDYIEANGGFSGPQRQTKQSKQTESKPNPKMKARKQAAGSPKGKFSAQQSGNDFNPLSMSDEEFEKIAATNI